tara:strand:- start:1286 stop:1792 length:507 start_codon:yes stop_codon:yes gene_type:complete
METKYEEMYNTIINNTNYKINLNIANWKGVRVMDMYLWKKHLHGRDGCEDVVGLNAKSGWGCRNLIGLECKNAQELQNCLEGELNDYSFCKITNSFVLEKKKYNELTITLEGFESTIQECCVCLDKTTSTTYCSHHLCLVCESKLVKTSSKCPMCRELYQCMDDDEDF